MPEKYDPFTENLWFYPFDANHYHLWKAGNPNSVCGLYWENAAYSFDCKPEQAALPANQLCPICIKEARFSSLSKALNVKAAEAFLVEKTKP